ncbi:MAG: hypothetical protein ACYTKD_30010 [Planctomycetota bacterium]|jgi:hypothetical protein
MRSAGTTRAVPKVAAILTFSLLCLSCAEKDTAVGRVLAAFRKGQDISYDDSLILQNAREPEVTEQLCLLYESEEKSISDRAAYILIHRPYREGAKDVYTDLLRRQRYVSNCAEACTQFVWRDAVPVLQGILDRPEHFGMYREAYEAIQVLEHKDIDRSLTGLGDRIAREARRENGSAELLARMEDVVASSHDRETAALVAISLCMHDAKANRGDIQRVRDSGMRILRRVPREVVEPILSHLAGNIHGHVNHRECIQEVLTRYAAQVR